MIIAYIGLGSNLDNPVQQINRALLALQAIPDTIVHRSSSLYQTTPVGFLAQPDFINAVAELHTTLSYRALFSQLQAIEKNQGRVRDGRKNHPRTLDLDFLLYGDLEINEPDLIIPHPRMMQRDFVLKPLLEIAPEVKIHPFQHFFD